MIYTSIKNEFMNDENCITDKRGTVMVLPLDKVHRERQHNKGMYQSVS